MRLSCPPINQSDVDFLISVYSSVRADEMAMVPWTDEQKTAFVRSQFESQHQHYIKTYPDAEFLKIELDGERIGRIYHYDSDECFHIIDLSILTEFRGKGVGTRLLTEILERTSKPVRIYLEVFNKYLGLFERLGFIPKRDEGIYRLWEAQGKGEPAMTASA